MLSSLLYMDVMNAGQHNSFDQLDQATLQYAEAHEMQACLTELLQQRSSISQHALSQQQGNASMQSGTCRIRNGQNGAAAAEIQLMQGGTGHKTHHEQRRPDSASIKGFMQEDGLFAYSCTRSH